ncbi:MAG: glycosyltransferase [Deltaproteobacteria bacterium]|nr:glycosyltransferase [Deltaproteobacteria bacterium]
MVKSQGNVPSITTARGADSPRIDSSAVSVVIPCRNEQATIGQVVRRIGEILPDAEILVVDNASTDETAREARAAGARVVVESRPGKGFALSTGFEAARDADYYVMLDGDDTYPADEVVNLLAAAAETGFDMVVGTRLASREPGAFRPGHTLGNQLFVGLVRMLFGIRTDDLFSGYRVLTRRFLAIAPLVAEGFDIEAELTISARVHGFQVVEIPVAYRARPPESSSKLHTYKDGFRILRGVMILFRDYRPLVFFGWLAAVLAVGSLWSGRAPVEDYFSTGLVRYVPRAILAATMGLSAILSLFVGVLLSSINRRAEQLAALIRKRSG